MKLSEPFNITEKLQDNTGDKEMKHRFIVITLLVTVFLSGCGGIATEVTTPIEEQVSSSINKVDPDTATSLAVSYYETVYGGKGIEFTYLEPTVEKLSKNEYRISFYVDAYCALPASPKNNETRYVECVATTENIMLGWSYETEMGLNEGFTGRPVFYKTQINWDGTYISDIDAQKEQPKPTQEPELSTNPSKAKQPDDFYTDGDYTTYGRYQCFETDTFVSVETQNGSLVLYFEPEADTFVLDRNGADTGWEFINWEFENRVYTSVTLQDNEMIISSTEPWRFDGTYIQMPDIGTDGEGE